MPIPNLTIVSGNSQETVLAYLIKSIRGMDELKRETLRHATSGIASFLGNEGFAPFKGKMLVGSVPDTVKLTRGMNAMRWYTKYFFTDTVKGFRQVYRVHSTTNTNVKPGTMASFKPRKPILSWSDSEKIDRVDIGGRNKYVPSNVKDYLVTMSVEPQDVIWSYKFTNWERSIDKAYKNFHKDSELRPILLALSEIAGMKSLAREREVTVYCGDSSFTAKVVRELEIL